MSKETPDQAGGRLPASLSVNNQIPLFSFDLNFDSLKAFLDKTTVTINQHAELINALQSELQVKQHTKVLPEVLGSFSEGGKIMDNTLSGIVKNQMSKTAKPENSGDLLASNSNKVYNRLTSLGYAVAYTFAQQQEYPGKIDALQKELAKKAIAESVREKHKKLKARMITDMEEMRKTFEKKILDVDAKYAAKINSFEDKVQAVEKKTLWKIQDCEEMLKKRITEEYVDDSCRVLEERIKRDLQHSTQADADHIERVSSELFAKMKALEDNVTEKNRQAKKLIKDVEDVQQQLYPPTINHTFNHFIHQYPWYQQQQQQQQQYLQQLTEVNNQCAKNVTVEELRKFLNSQLEALNRRQKELESQVQIQPILERQNIRIKSVEDKMNDLASNLSNRIQDLSLMITSQAGRGSSNGEGASSLSGVDLHKLCQIEGDLLRAQDTLRNHGAEIDTMKNTVMNKLENIDVNVFEAMSRGGNGGGGGGNGGRLGDLEETVSNLSAHVSQLLAAAQGNSGGDAADMKRIALEVKELAKRIESLRDLEKRVQRIFKEFDINQINRMIKGKAEQDEVMRDFAIVDTKINSNSDQIAFCRKDIDNLILLYKKLVGSMTSSGSQGDLGSILSTKKLHPFSQLNCLSCGVTKNSNHSQIHAVQQNTLQTRGSDGKNYRIDVSMHNETMTTLEQQKSIFQNQSMTSLPQATNSTKLARPHTAQIRPTEQNMSQVVGLSGTSPQQQTFAQSQVGGRVNTQQNNNQKRQLRPESAKK